MNRSIGVTLAGGPQLGTLHYDLRGRRETGRGLGMSAQELEPFADAFEHRERDAVRKRL